MGTSCIQSPVGVQLFSVFGMDLTSTSLKDKARGLFETPAASLLG